MEENKQNQVMILRLSCVISSILKKWKVIILVCLVCGMGFDVVKTLTYKPLYSTSLTATLTQENNTYSQLEETLSYIKTLNYILNGEIVDEYVIQKMDVENLQATISVSSVSNTNVVRMQVTSPSRKEAYYTLDYLVDWYHEFQDQYKFAYDLNIQDKNPMNMNPINPNSHFTNFRNGSVISGALIVVILGCIAYLRDTIKTPNDISSKIDCRLFSKVPKESKPKGKKFWVKQRKALLITSLKTSFYYKESIKKLRSRFEESAKKHDYKTLLITSSLENEGKSSIAANLAISLAQNNKKVLLIDADIRKPSMHKIFDVKSDLSLNEYLESNKDYQSQLIQYKNTSLDILCAQKDIEHAEEFMHSPRLSEMIQKARDIYDYVIIDSSPARYLNDPSVINELVDASLLVIKQDNATVEVINETIGRITNVKNNLIGCIYNASILDIVKQHKVYGYHYGYNRYTRRRED